MAGIIGILVFDLEDIKKDFINNEDKSKFEQHTSEAKHRNQNKIEDIISIMHFENNPIKMKILEEVEILKKSEFMNMFNDY